ncbi:enoyl-CoA hydratase/isomerase family protein [Patulibacter defluvii]|uniref:enoyl-CoA hydratase/isomerase family protein n=1 Tax=Patulibacter defluvii TaxID=3095358 RepID=UPI002A758CE7|nr:enoyl-CoA hydratase/isomerase family protein [Patulibacter sp. DM4]
MAAPADDDAPVVLAARDGAIGRITLNRPAARNAITTELAVALEADLRSLAADDEVAVIVIRGAGGQLSVGGDFHELERLRTSVDPPPAEAMAGLFRAFRGACDAIAELPIPVVVAVEGYAMAGGFELIQAADVAIARDDAVLADNHANFGQVPGGGGSQRLARLVGRPRALGLLLTGDRLSGAQAAAWGLVYRAVPADDFEDALAALLDQLAGKDRTAAARTKALVRGGLDGPLAAGLDRELEVVLEHLGSAAAAAGIDRFATRSRPSAGDPR